ncbi:MAG: hypothetical protein IEMM0002_0843 [bacterium]|nr:MAG: hypothetical protein IEMM0002_0843 [bacterium]
MKRNISGGVVGLTSVAGVWTPPMDLFETEEYICINAELAGVEESGIEIGIEGNVITIRGERRLSVGEEKGFICVERSYGSFIRTFKLPASVTAGGMNVELSMGVLKVTLPKSGTCR